MSNNPPRQGDQPSAVPPVPRRAAPTSSKSAPIAQAPKTNRPPQKSRPPADDYYDDRVPPQREYRYPRQGPRPGSRPPYRNARSRYEPPRRDSFPIIMGAVVGMLIVAILVVVYLLLSRNSCTTQANTNTATGNNANPAVQPAGSAVAAGQPTALAMSQSGTSTGSSSAQQTMEANRPANGLGTPMPDEGNTHVADGTVITYKNYPPSSGTHYSTPAQAGFYDTPQQEGNFVHSLEHGYVVLYYKPDLPDATKQQLKDLMTKLPMSKYNKVKMVIVPYTNMTTPLAIAAWDRLLPMSDYNFDVIQTFYQQYVDRGPEDVP